ncbi:acyl-CoA dehydrogenase C-terminal domain-containing protein [Streptomyces sp. NPDC005811]|uniref:acyl-CoA dehydrogenase C-terminal domain-containing protein n=1 Tax=Streptomyces sp. NPDC005811 TaxID=3154565 RepID=UPI003406AEAA
MAAGPRRHRRGLGHVRSGGRTRERRPYLQGFGHVVLAWILLDVAVAAAGSVHREAPGKTAAMRYFFAYELPKTGAWLDVVARRESLCREVPVADL